MTQAYMKFLLLKYNVVAPFIILEAVLMRDYNRFLHG